MNTSALITLLASELIITGFTIYFFIKVLRIPPRDEPDSYTDNDL